MTSSSLILVLPVHQEKVAHQVHQAHQEKTLSNLIYKSKNYMLNCKYCKKECKNNNSLAQHEIR